MTKKKTNPDIDFLQQAAEEANKEGFEDVNLSTIAVPFVRILQDLSPQLKKSKPEFVEGAESGMIFNNTSERIYPAPLRFIAIKFERYFIEWGESRGQFIAVHDPQLVEGQMHKFFRDDKNKLMHIESKHHYSETYMYYIVLPDFPEEGIVILALSSTQIKEARRLNRGLITTMIPGTTQKALPFFIIWSLAVVERSNERGDWWGIKTSFEGLITQPLLETVTEARLELPNQQVDYSQLQIEGSDEASDDTGGAPNGKAKF